MTPYDENSLTINGAVVRDIVRRRRATLVGVGLAVLLGLDALQLLVMPQTYSATVSIAVQQPSASGGALAMLTAQPQSKKYMGVIRSRLLASDVEDQVHLQQLYHLPTRQKAVEMLMNAVKADDNAADGLLFITVNLPGPPAFAPGGRTKQTLVKQAVMQAANQYQHALSRYYTYSDNDRDAILLRNGDRYLVNARKQFDIASANVRNFVLGLKISSMAEAPAGSAEGAASAPSGLQMLLNEEATVDAQLSAATAEQSARTRDVAGQLADTNRIPADDPLLREARNRVDDAELELKNLQATYGPDAPRYQRAVNKLAVAREDLARQAAGVRKGRSSVDIEAKNKIVGLKARKTSLLTQINAIMSKLPTRSRTTTALEELRAEQKIALTRLETTEAKVAELQLSSASGKSRFVLVDSAILPERGTPGAIRATLLSLLAALFVSGGLLFREYLRGLRRMPRVPDNLAASVPALPDTAITTPLSVHPEHSNGNGIANGNGSNGTDNGNGSKTRRRPRL